MNLLIPVIRFYQKLPISTHGYCKHIPSCSNYALEAIERYGSIKGSILSFKRIVKCNPFNKGGFDPVPKEEK